MASGLPIITTRCEGVDELITGNGIVLEQADAGQMAEAIKKLVNDKPLLEKMSQAARRQAESFTWNAVAQMYIQLYRQIAGL